MRNVVVLGGLPRSGTTSIYEWLRRVFPHAICPASEVEMLADTEYLQHVLKGAGELYSRHFDWRHDGYSRFGRSEDFIENKLLLDLAAHDVLNMRHIFEAGELPDAYMERANDYRNRPIDQLLHGDLLLKKPFSELNIKLIQDVLQKSNLIFIYCLRSLPAVFDSNIESVKWFESDSMADLARRSAECATTFEAKPNHTLLYVKIEKLASREYRNKVIAKLESLMGLKSGRPEQELPRLNSFRGKDDPGIRWTEASINSLAGGPEALSAYKLAEAQHDAMWL